MTSLTSKIATEGARWLAAIGIVTLLLALAAPLATAHPIDSNWTPPRTVYIPETGHTIDRLFLDTWRAWDGAASFGNPITEEFEEDGHVVQYYEYARFEYWPEDPTGTLVHLGDIGADLAPFIVGDLKRAAKGDDEGAREAARARRAFAPLASDDVGPDTADRRYVPETRHTVQQGFKAFWEATGEAGYLGNPVSEEYVRDGVTYQLFERGQLRWERNHKVRMVPVGTELAKRRKLDTAPVPQGNLPIYDEALFVPPPARPDPATAPPSPVMAGKAIVVSLSQQALWAYEGGEVVLSTYVSTGKPRFETPPGTYQVLVKKPVEDMEGVIGGEYYNVPQVPDVLYFTDVGHAIHGTYWHDNFGAPMSHGCVNVPTETSKALYDWAPVGMPVVVVP